ncbi:MAG: arylesterase [Pseudomonadota bacterium]
MRKMITGLVFLMSGTLATAEPVTIAALGDSLTQGYGLPIEDGLVQKLQTWLTDQGAEVALINAGVSGDTTAGGAARVDWALTPEVDAMIVALGANDLLRGIDPASSRANMEVILSGARDRNVPVLLIGFEAPGNFGPDYKASFDAIYPELADAFGALYLDSFFKGLETVTTDPAAMRAFLQPDGLHPNADGVDRIVEGIGPSVLDLIALVESEAE